MSTTYEKHLLATLLLQGSIGYAKTLPEADFDSAVHRCLFKAMLACDEAGFEINIPELEKRLRDSEEFHIVGGLSGIVALTDISPIDVAQAVDRIQSDAQKRRLNAALHAALKSTEPDTMALAAIESVEAFRNSKASFYTLEQCIEASLSQEGDTGIKTYTVLDRHLANGGLLEGRMYVVGARPKVGKTGLSCNIAVSAARQGCIVAFFSLEMAEGEVGTRIGRIIKPHEESSLDIRVWTKIDSAAQINRELFTLRAQNPTKRIVVICDHLQLMTLQPGFASMTHRVGELSGITRMLKRSSIDLRMAVVCLSQLNREIEKRDEAKPTLADLRDSGSIEQDADCVILLYKKDETVHALFAAQRHAETGGEEALTMHKGVFV